MPEANNEGFNRDNPMETTSGNPQPVEPFDPEAAEAAKAAYVAQHPNLVHDEYKAQEMAEVEGPYVDKINAARIDLQNGYRIKEAGMLTESPSREKEGDQKIIEARRHIEELKERTRRASEFAGVAYDEIMKIIEGGAEAEKYYPDEFNSLLNQLINNYNKELDYMLEYSDSSQKDREYYESRNIKQTRDEYRRIIRSIEMLQEKAKQVAAIEERAGAEYRDTQYAG